MDSEPPYHRHVRGQPYDFVFLTAAGFPATNAAGERQPGYMLPTRALPNSEHLTSLALSINRAKS